MGLSVYVTDVVLPNDGGFCDLLHMVKIPNESVDGCLCDECARDEVIQFIGGWLTKTVPGCQDGPESFEWCYADDRENWFYAEKAN